jgi:eukaryotic-like serine/threonine-protein kinase
LSTRVGSGSWTAWWRTTPELRGVEDAVLRPPCRRCKAIIINRVTRFAQRFVLERQIGAGGMARVYLGRDEVLDRPVAVKVLNPVHGGTDIAERFRREGRTAARLSHPNIVPVYGAGEGEFEGREASYIVMEYVPGGDLKDLLDANGPLPNVKLARLGAEVSSGLAHAHERGVIHRDIKPHNVLIDDHGLSKLADFGIARALDATQATQTGSYLGTALYSSPEQLQGERVTPKSDVYSLGVTLYEAAVGQAPFVGTPIEVASQHINKEPDEPSALGARLSAMTEALILECIQKDPDGRPTAEEVHERLLDAAVYADRPTRQARAALISLETPEKTEHTRAFSSEAPTTIPPAAGAWRRAGRRRRALVILAAALLLTLLGVAAYAATLAGEEPDTTQAPQEEGEQASSPPGNAEGAEDGEGQVSAEDEQEDADTSGTSSDPSEEGAERAVEEFYETAVSGDFGRHSGLMTPEWRQLHYPEQGQFENTYSTLRSLEFVEGPTAEVSGDTATVTGETIARHTYETQHNGGTWTLVYQNGEWRISGWNVYPISAGPPQ